MPVVKLLYIKMYQTTMQIYRKKFLIVFWILFVYMYCTRYIVLFELLIVTVYINMTKFKVDYDIKWN